MKITKYTLLISLFSAASVCFVGRASARDLELNLHVYPNPFIAGYQYSGEFARVWFKTRYAGISSVYIYDFEGNLVRTLSENAEVGPGEHEIAWDGSGDGGNLVAPGPYVVVLELKIQGESYRDTFVAIAYR